MNGQKALLLVIAFTTLGVVVLPQTVSLFAGEHYWYDLSGNTSDVPCEKCHADVMDEMEALAGPHMGESGYSDTATRFKCEYCHRTFPINYYTKDWLPRHINQSIKNAYSYTYGSVSSVKTVNPSNPEVVTGHFVQPGKEAHAASTVPCLYCHSGGGYWSPHAAGNRNCFDSGCHPEERHGHDKPEYFDVEDCWNCHVGYDSGGNPKVYYVPPAGGFGWTEVSGDTGSLAAHKAFIDEAIKDTTLTHANEACIACHTGIAVKINWTHARSIEFDIGFGKPFTTEEGPHNWTVTEWTHNGTAKATVWGNTTGNGTTTYGSIEWPGNVGSYT